MEKILTKNWVKEASTMVEQGYVIIQEGENYYWVK